MSKSEPFNFLELFTAWAVNGMTPLIAIKGYAELLLKESNSESLTEQQRQFIEIIYFSSLRAIDYWSDPKTYLALHNDQISKEWAPLKLSEIVSSAVSSLKDYEIGKVQTELPDSLPLVRGNEWLVFTISYLIYPKTYMTSPERQTVIKAHLTEDSEVLVHISTEIELHPAEKEYPELIFYPGERLLTARMIIEKLYGSQLITQVVDKSLNCEFILPIWNLASDIPLEVNLTVKNNGETVDLRIGQHLNVAFPSADLGENAATLEYNPEILYRGVITWDSATKIEHVCFWPYRIGRTSLTIGYHAGASSAVEIFSIEIKVRA